MLRNPTLYVCLLAFQAQAKDKKVCGTTAQPTVTVWFNNTVGVNSADDRLTIAYARHQAVQMFSGVGIKLVWRTGIRGGTPSCGETLAIDVATDADQSVSGRFPTSALAFATVGSKQVVDIHLFYNRIMGRRAPELKRALLAHVIVHEITHVLEGIARHSDYGVMKADWDEIDFKAMMSKPLPFARIDAELVQAHFGVKGVSVQ